MFDKLKRIINRNSEDQYGITIQRTILFNKRMAPKGFAFYIAISMYNKKVYTMAHLIERATVQTDELEDQLKRKIKDEMIAFIKTAA